MGKIKSSLLIVVPLILALSAGCSNSPSTITASPSMKPKISSPLPTVRPQTTRAEAVPPIKYKMTAQNDDYPPVLNSTLFQQPVPLGNGVNTTGSEDSAFIMADGNSLYFFFTPDANIPTNKQLLDNLTGIWVSKKVNGEWQAAQRVWLQDIGKVSLDGCVFIQGDQIWFGSLREGNYRAIDIWTAEFKDGAWRNWKNAGQKINDEYQVGEFHITADGKEMYFHSPKTGGKGKNDIWLTRKVNGEWQTPENVEAINSAEDEALPFITQDGNELWFTKTYQGSSSAIYRSKKIDGHWDTPEMIISQLASEPSLDNAGNLYFTHQFIKNGIMVESDIYVAYRK